MGWFEDWFGTKYYKLLYSHRSEEEAAQFISNLISRLQPAPGARVLDVGCGQGRHSRYLAEMGFDVTGIDLEPENIAEASEYTSDRLHFFEHDMRKPFPVNNFDLIVNLFTSFGYFATDEEDLKTLKNMHDALAADGRIVIDFFNAACVKSLMVPHTKTETHEGVQFNISKRVEGHFVIKEIEVNDNGEISEYCEKVKLLTLPYFEDYFAKTNLSIAEKYGNYALEPFDPVTSDRLLMILKKND